MTRTAEPATRTRSWTAVHCHLSWRTEDVDGFLVHDVKPLLDGLRMAGRVADWYFLRAEDGGLTLRVRGADWCTVKAMRADLGRLIARAPHPVLTERGRFAHGAVRETDHASEADRFGGHHALAHAEDVFCRATDLALSVLADAGTAEAKLAAATELVMATALALGMDRHAAASWLRARAADLPPTTDLPGARAHRAAVRTVEPLDLDLSWDRLARTRDHALVRWTNTVRRARRALEGRSDTPPLGAWRAVWGAHLHLLLNRLGLTPEQERALCVLTAASVLARRGTGPVFAERAPAAAAV